MQTKRLGTGVGIRRGAGRCLREGSELQGNELMVRAGEGSKPEPLYPKLVARRNAPAKVVAAHQRARLHAAMIEACARHGYAETTARELVALAGVSTKALYQHFGSKEKCFLATFDVIVAQAIGRISGAYRGGPNGAQGDWSAGLCRAFDAFVDELIERPAPSRLALVEILAAASPALARIDRAEAHFATMIAGSLAGGRDGVEVPPAIVRPLVGGIWFVARTRFLEARPRDVSAGGAELREWLLAYRSPATARVPAPPPRRSGRAPGEPNGDDGEAPERLRMLRAARGVVARGGYAALSVGEVVEAAGLGEAEFTAQFGSVSGCFLDLLDWMCAGALAEALRASEGAATWGGGVCCAVEALFHRLADDPGLARAAFLDVFDTGPVGAARLAAILRSFAAALVRRAPPAGRPSPLVAEAIAGAVWSIAHRHIVRGRRTRLPGSWARASFLVLAPILGPEAALATVVAERDRRLPRPPT